LELILPEEQGINYIDNFWTTLWDTDYWINSRGIYVLSGPISKNGTPYRDTYDTIDFCNYMKIPHLPMVINPYHMDRLVAVYGLSVPLTKIPLKPSSPIVKEIA
jgi:hypothetical protein